MKFFTNSQIFLLVSMFCSLTLVLEGQNINVDLQNVTYDITADEICFDVYMSAGTGYPGGAPWSNMNIRLDANFIAANGSPILGAATVTGINTTYLSTVGTQSHTSVSNIPPGTIPAGYESAFGMSISKGGASSDLPATPTLMYSVCIAVTGGEIANDPADMNNAFQMRTGLTPIGSNWSSAVSSPSTRRPFVPLDAQEPLPIELHTFEPRISQCDVVLYWETASEKNLGYFQLEASKDGREFKAIAQKKPETPNSSSLRVYKYEVPENYQGYYFRLKAVDLDGAFEYSKIVYTEVPCGKNYSLQAYPNPSYLSELTVEVNSPENHNQVQFFLLDNFGKRLREQKIDLSIGVNKIQMPVEDLPSGTYFIQIIGVAQLHQPLKFVRSNF